MAAAIKRRARGTAAAWLVGWMLAVSAGLSACGGGGGGGDGRGDGAGAAPPPPAPATAASAVTPGGVNAPAGTSLITLFSDPGDWVGDGRQYAYDLNNAGIRVSTIGRKLSIQIDGAQQWSADFLLPGGGDRLQPGVYTGLTRYPFQAVGAGALSWSGQGRACNTVLGSVQIDAVTYSAGVLQAIDMSFEQRCEGNLQAALRGQIRITPEAMLRMAAPQNPQPERPVVALQSDPGDYIGQGGSYGYDGSTASVTVKADGPQLSVSVRGDEQWSGEFRMPANFSQWVPGVYAGLTRYPFQPAGAGALSWSGEGRGCNTLNGTITVQSVRYEAGVLRAIALDFEQRCEGGATALRGKLRWDAALATPAPGPLNPVPAGLWSPPADAMPASGNAMVLVSDPGDYIGQGWTWRVGAAAGGGGEPGDVKGTVAVTIEENEGLLKIGLKGTLNLDAQFKAMDGLTRLQAGYYGVVQRYPFHNPARGGLSISAESRGCNRLSGWFAIDSIEYLNGRLSALDLRFVQHCEAGVSALRGRVRWRLASPAT